MLFPYGIATALLPSLFNTFQRAFRFAYSVHSATNATGWLPGRQIMDSSQPPIDHALDGQSKVPEIIAVLIVCTVLSTGLVTLRSYSRAFISGGFGADDWALVAAQVCVTFSGTIIVFGRYSSRPAND